MKNVVLWGWSDVDAMSAVRHLASNKDINIVAWVADIKSSESYLKSYKNFLYNQPDFGVFKSQKYDFCLTDSEMLKFLDMFSREKRSRGINIHEQSNIAKNYFRYFLWYLKENNVDVVLFSIVPIIGFDYLCYLAAKKLGVKVTMCYQSLFPNRFFYVNDLDDFGFFADVPEISVPPPAIDWRFKKDLFYMKGAIRASRDLNKFVKLIREFWRYGIRKSSKPMRISGVVENFSQAKDFQKSYKINAIPGCMIDPGINFIYFPLHLQPELTTSGLGGGFSDQLDAIERLSEMLPDGWRIYVKENPKQGFEQRGVEFYNRLKTIAGVHYIAKSVDTYWLMENCRFVATITGTAGWESITGGKPCLVFGLAWFLGMPGAIKYRPGITVDEVLNSPVIVDEQIKSFSSLYNKMRDGITDRVYASIFKGYDARVNVKNLVEFMKLEIFGE